MLVFWASRAGTAYQSTSLTSFQSVAHGGSTSTNGSWAVSQPICSPKMWILLFFSPFLLLLHELSLWIYIANVSFKLAGFTSLRSDLLSQLPGCGDYRCILTTNLSLPAVFFSSVYLFLLFHWCIWLWMIAEKYFCEKPELGIVIRLEHSNPWS